MKKMVILCSTIFIVAFMLGCITFYYFLSSVKGIKPLGGVVKDETTAIKVAEAVLFPIYGEDEIIDQRPYKAIFDPVTQCWSIKGSLPENTLGGVFEIVIRKSNGQILYISHGK